MINFYDGEYYDMKMVRGCFAKNCLPTCLKEIKAKLHKAAKDLRDLLEICPNCDCAFYDEHREWKVIR
ncbi:MAG: hypothetical protein U0586_08675 [Candidatus Brocadiaceae bacterium]